MCQSVPSVKGPAGVYMDWAKWISQTIVFPLIGIAMSAVLWGWWTHEQDIDELRLGQQSRFTAEDGNEVWQSIAESQREIVTMHERLSLHLETTLPASELVRMSTYQKEYLDHDRRIGKLEGGQ